MSDMKQVAERLRNSRTPEGFTEVYGAFLDGAHCDEQEAIGDWLAERDPTPLTVEVLEAMGETDDERVAGFIHSAVAKMRMGKLWVNGMKSVSTVGELRTLARLAGVELTKGGE